MLFICRLRPDSIRVPECAKNEYYIINKSEDIRPYGLVVNFLESSLGETTRKNQNFDGEW